MIIICFSVQYRIISILSYGNRYLLRYSVITSATYYASYRTYFHRELSEDDKRLIGDTTPKPIKTGQAVGQSSPSGVVSPSNSTKKTNIIESQSQWNAGMSIYIINKLHYTLLPSLMLYTMVHM